MCKVRLIAVALLALAVPAAHAASKTEALEGYDAVSQALADDDLAAAKKTAQTLAEATATSQPELAAAARQLAASESLTAARKAFKEVSVAAVALAKGEPGYHVMTCPMVSADWVQKTQKLHNPYMGKAMLECGVPKE